MAKSLKKVLIAEDEKALASVLSLKLKNAGFEVVVADNGEQALTELRAQPIDLLILDLVMPKVDGFGVLEAVKKEGIKIPIIVTSNLSQEEDIARARALGAAEFFIKADTALTDIVAKVQHHLG